MVLQNGGFGYTSAILEVSQTEDDEAHSEDTYPRQGFCRTPMILWILSIATLSWKLLSPGKENSDHENDEPYQHCGAHVWTVSVIRNGCLKKKNSLNFTKTPNEAISSTCLNMVLPPTDTLHAYQMTQKPQLEPGERCVLTLSNTFVTIMCDDARFLSVKNDICVSNQC